MQVQVFANQGYYTAKHNALYDVVLPVVSGNAWKLLDVILRQTKGWNRESVGLGVRDLMRLAGIRSEHTILSALRELREFPQGNETLSLIIEIRPENRWEPTRYSLNRKVKLDWSPVAENATDCGQPTAKTATAPVAENATDTAIKTATAPVAENATFNQKEKNSDLIEKTLVEKSAQGESPNPLLPILIEAYRPIIRKPADETQLAWQAEELHGKGVTKDELNAWLNWRKSRPAIPFIAEKVLLWQDDQRREKSKRNADAYVGSSQITSVSTIAASILPAEAVEQPKERKGNWGRVLGLLDRSLPVGAVVTWLEPLSESRVDDGVLYLNAPGALFREFIENNYANEFYEAAEVAGFRAIVIETLSAQSESSQEVAA